MIRRTTLCSPEPHTMRLPLLRTAGILYKVAAADKLQAGGAVPTIV